MHQAPSEVGFELVSARKLSPFVGRDFELRELEESLERIQDGCTIVISGDSGVGKTRLLRIAQSRAEARGSRWIVGRCSPRYRNFAFHPVASVVERLLNGSEQSAWPLSLRDGSPEAVEVMAALFETNRGRDRPPPPLAPRELRTIVLRALVDIVQQAASRASVVLVVEDLHWADASTLEFLTLLVAQGPVPRLAVCVTTGSNPARSWSTSSQVKQIALDPLDDEQAEQMVRAIAGNVFPPEVVTDIARCAEGGPLVIEELTEMVAEMELSRVTDGNQRFDPNRWPTLPATLRETLATRFSRLGSARDVAQVGATIGQEFDLATLRMASRFDDAPLLEDLEKLTSAGLVVQDDESGTGTYRFKHVLVQDAAYGMMLKSTRRQWHRRVAEALREGPAEGRIAHSHVLAFHYTEAGMYQHAIEYWIQAGKGCLEWACAAEAQAHLRRARALLQLLPQKDRRPFDSDVQQLLEQTGNLWRE